MRDSGFMALRGRRVADLWCTAEALDIKLTEEEIKSLEEPYQPTAIYGHW